MKRLVLQRINFLGEAKCEKRMFSPLLNFARYAYCNVSESLESLELFDFCQHRSSLHSPYSDLYSRTELMLSKPLTRPTRDRLTKNGSDKLAFLAVFEVRSQSRGVKGGKIYARAFLAAEHVNDEHERAHLSTTIPEVVKYCPGRRVTHRRRPCFSAKRGDERSLASCVF